MKKNLIKLVLYMILNLFLINSGFALGPVHFIVTKATAINCTILIPLSANPKFDGVSLVSGDEIAIFNNKNICCGAKVWDDTNTAITVYGATDVPIPQDGMANLEDFKYRIWKSTEDKEYSNVVVTYTSGNGKFSANSFHFVGSFNAYSTTNINNNSYINKLILIYQNPNNSQIHLKINSETYNNIKISIIDLSGNILNEFNESNIIGEKEFILNTESFSSGIYFVLVNYNNNLIWDKFVVF